MGYRKKDAVELAWDRTKRRIRCESQNVLARVLNDALAEANDMFAAGVNRGQLLDIGATPEELADLLRRAAERELGPISGGRRALSTRK